MKRTIVFAILFATILIGSCYGEVLTSGLSIGTGQFGIEGFYSSTNVTIADSTLTEFGPRVVYGLADDLDITGKLAMGSISNVSATTLGGGIKYTFLKIANQDPIDMAALANFESASAKDFTLSTTTFGIVGSKMVRTNLTLYGFANVAMLSTKVTGIPSSSGTGLQFGGGLKFQVNKKVSFAGELGMMNIDSNSYTTFSLGLQFLMD